MVDVNSSFARCSFMNLISLFDVRLNLVCSAPLNIVMRDKTGIIVLLGVFFDSPGSCGGFGFPLIQGFEWGCMDSSRSSLVTEWICLGTQLPFKALTPATPCSASLRNNLQQLAAACQAGKPICRFPAPLFLLFFQASLFPGTKRKTPCRKR
jgi:hypothetical protein